MMKYKRMCLSIISFILLLSSFLIPVQAEENFTRYSSPISYSYLVADANGYMKVELTSEDTIVKYYDHYYTLLETKTIPLELHYTAGFYAGQDSYYLFYCNLNDEEDDSKEFLRVVQYDKNWNRIQSGAVSGMNTVRIDRDISVAEYGDYLFLRTARIMYKSWDGINHQANLTIQMRKSDLKEIKSFNAGYVSHSFEQFIKVDPLGNIVALDHGDGYPRASVLGMYSGIASENGVGDRYYPTNIIEYQGEIGNNYTGSGTGGLEFSSTHYLTVGDSVEQNENWENNDSYNVYLSATPIQSFLDVQGQYQYEIENKITWLTTYPEGSRKSTSCPKLVKLSDDYFMVLWVEMPIVYDGTENTRVSYVFVDGKGDVVGNIQTVEAGLSDCQPSVYDNRVTWYVDHGTYSIFYAIEYFGTDGSSSFHPQTVVGLSKNELYLTTKEGVIVNHSEKVEAKVHGYADQNLTWRSSNPSIASVDQNGVITGISDPYVEESSVTITATTSNGVSGSVKVTVSDPVSAFVRRLYSLCLGRNADQTGFSYWIDRLNSGKTTAAQAAHGFLFSKEMNNRHLNDDKFIEKCYQVMMEREYDEAGKAHWKEQLKKGISREKVLNGFVGSHEFFWLCTKYGINQGTITLTQARDQNDGVTAFVVRCYSQVLGRNFDVNGLNYWTGRIMSSANKKEAAVSAASNGFFNSNEFKNKGLNDADFIRVCYRTFLDREADRNGLNYWLGRMSEGKEVILKGFANSNEFSAIMARFGIQ